MTDIFQTSNRTDPADDPASDRELELPEDTPDGDNQEEIPSETLAVNLEALATERVGAKPSEEAQQAGPAERKVRKKRSRLGSGRGVETMFRTSYRVHTDLTALADNKANIMISINGLIISIMLFALIELIRFSQWLIIPSSMLVVTCLVSIVYAVLSARPRINPNPVTRTSIEANRANILFFGNFAHLTESEFLDGMTSMMSQVDNIYLSMMRDIYGMGRVLSKKFALLKKAYTVFMVGLIISILLFLVSFILLAMETASLI